MPKDDPVFNSGKQMKHEQFEKRKICDKFVTEITNPGVRSMSPKVNSHGNTKTSSNIVIANIIVPQNKIRESQTNLDINNYGLKNQVVEDRGKLQVRPKFIKN